MLSRTVFSASLQSKLYLSYASPRRQPGPTFSPSTTRKYPAPFWGVNWGAGRRTRTGGSDEPCSVVYLGARGAAAAVPDVPTETQLPSLLPRYESYSNTAYVVVFVLVGSDI